MHFVNHTEENYIKAIYEVCLTEEEGATTNQIADKMSTKASSVTDMLKKLAERKLINYKKYQGVSLTKSGNKMAIEILRKHRLWEVFLVGKLGFNWDEVHDIAEQLEHVQSEVLVDKLDKFLDHPSHDPHGEPIPDKSGKIKAHQNFMLSDLKKGESGLFVGVRDSSDSFLKMLDKLNIRLGEQLTLMEVYDFDLSIRVLVNKKKEVNLSQAVIKNIYIKKQ